MACLRCGRETEGAFCEKCLKDMEKYPVRAVIPKLNIREREEYYSHKVYSRNVTISQEQQLRRKDRQIHRLRTAVAVLMAVLLLLGGASAYVLSVMQKEDMVRPIGQNFMVNKSREETLPAESTPEESEETQADVSRETD